MNLRQPIRLAVSVAVAAVVALALDGRIAIAQETETLMPAAPQNGSSPQATGSALERAARENATRMDAQQKVRDDRVKRVTRSICAGCAGSANRPQRHARQSADEPRPRDPAQAPED